MTYNPSKSDSPNQKLKVQKPTFDHVSRRSKGSARADVNLFGVNCCNGMP